jgi:hypothetical protein
VVLTQDEHKELQQMSVSRTLPAGDVFRARLILMLAAGRSYAEVQERLNTTAPTISLWKKRFVEYRIVGLMEERHPGQKPTVITPPLQAKVLAATRRKPKDGSTHWSCRKLAKELGISKDTVHRIWRIAGLRPHRLERYMASNDPEFESKAADIIGLYLNPPQHAGRKVRHSGLGPFGSRVANVAWSSRAPRVRVLSPWNAVAVRGLGCEIRKGARQNRSPAYQ